MSETGRRANARMPRRLCHSIFVSGDRRIFGKRVRMRSKAIAASAKADLAAVASFPPEIYRFPALADVTAALEKAAFEVHVVTDGANEPVLLLAEKWHA
jgi:hypothetical protein